MSSFFDYLFLQRFALRRFFDYLFLQQSILRSFFDYLCRLWLRVFEYLIKMTIKYAKKNFAQIKVHKPRPICKLLFVAMEIWTSRFSCSIFYSCSSCILIFCHWSVSDAKHWVIRTVFIAVTTCVWRNLLRFRSFQWSNVFVWISLNSLSLNFLLAQSHRAEIFIVKRFIQGRNY